MPAMERYAESMQIIPMPDHGQLLLVVTPYVTGGVVFDLTARLALAGDLEVIDGGNTFNAYCAVRALQRAAPDLPDAARMLERVRLARAFTCYQLAALLETLESASPAPDGATAGQAVPLLVMDLLATFGDQGVAVRERRRLLNGCLAGLKRLSARGHLVGVWVRARTVVPEEMTEFQARVEQSAGRVWRLQAVQPAELLQGRLF